MQAWIDLNLPADGGDPAELAIDVMKVGINLDSIEPEWGVSLKDIIHEALQHRDEAGRPE
ncbi:MAG: hypothetical protein ACTHJQ_23820 [Rhizobiaceae bacterium]